MELRPSCILLMNRDILCIIISRDISRKVIRELKGKSRIKMKMRNGMSMKTSMKAIL